MLDIDQLKYDYEKPIIDFLRGIEMRPAYCDLSGEDIISYFKENRYCFSISIQGRLDGFNNNFQEKFNEIANQDSNWFIFLLKLMHKHNI